MMMKSTCEIRAIWLSRQVDGLSETLVQGQVAGRDLGRGEWSDRARARIWAANVLYHLSARWRTAQHSTARGFSEL